LPDRCLAVFVDDTGHEALARGHLVFGLGGCAVLGRDLVRLIWQPWKAIRKRVTGSPDTPLHASEFAKIARTSDIEAVAEFFRVQAFARFGAIISVNTKLEDELTLMQTMKAVIQQRVNDIMQPTLCRDVKIIFESSERANMLIQETFQDFELRRGWKHIPSECYFLPKAAAEPALEVADFVMHAVGSASSPKSYKSRIICAGFQSGIPRGASNPRKLHGGRIGYTNTVTNPRTAPCRIF